MDRDNLQTTLAEERRLFHADLLQSGTLVINDKGIPSNADSSQKSSRLFASHIAKALQTSTVGERLVAQTSGGNFEKAVAKFLSRTFPLLSALRPGDWHIMSESGRRRDSGISQYVPYQHLHDLDRAVLESPVLRTIVGNSYSISPDIVITRAPVLDQEIEEGGMGIDTTTATLTPIRSMNQTQQILHAVVSCKWTIRSDRAQNARSEALNLIRNRKGRSPHITVVTGEPTPSRISSLALGTGDIDCVYHFALPELRAAVETSGNDEAQSMLMSMIEGERLRDISDLPLDLAI